MTLAEYCDTLNLTLEVCRYPNQNERWCASWEHADKKGDGVLIGVHGNGPTPQAAINDYLRQMRGGVVVIHAMDAKHRREYMVPESLELLGEPPRRPTLTMTEKSA